MIITILIVILINRKFPWDIQFKMCFDNLSTRLKSQHWNQNSLKFSLVQIVNCNKKYIENKMMQEILNPERPKLIII